MRTSYSRPVLTRDPSVTATRRTGAGLALAALALSGCSSQLPPPETRPLITYTGVRLTASPDHMVEVEEWVTAVTEDITYNPDFWMDVVWEQEARYPWYGLEIATYDDRADTVTVHLAEVAADAETPYTIYGHMRLNQEIGTLEEWIPGTEELSPFEVERAILLQISDVWLLGRSVFDTAPFGPLDELLYANEFGYLDDFILATQGDRFPEAAETFRTANPGRAEEFRAWFQETFERDGPGHLPDPEEEEPGGGSGTPSDPA